MRSRRAAMIESPSAAEPAGTAPSLDAALQVLAPRLAAAGAWDEEFAVLTAQPLAHHRRRLGPCLPSPFVSMWAAPPVVRTSWAVGNPAPLIDHLRSPASLQRRHWTMRTHRSDALLRSAPDATTLLTSEEWSTWADEGIRQHLLDGARQLWSPPGPVRRQPTSPGLVSVVLAFDGQSPSAPESVRHTLAEQGDFDVEVVVVDTGAPVGAALHMWAVGFGRPRMRYDIAAPPETLAQAFAQGLEVAAGERVVFVGPDIRLPRGWLRGVVDVLDDDAVLASQPVVLDRQGGIASAGLGTASDSGLVHPLLEGHRPEDARHVSPVALSALGGGVVAMRTIDAREIGGPSKAMAGILLEADLTLRLAEHRDGRCVVMPDVQVQHTVAPSPQPTEEQTEQFARRWRSVLASDKTVISTPILDSSERGRPGRTLRWGLRIASSPGPMGDVWGDTFFASSLAQAFRRLDQEAVIYRRGQHASPGSERDEVVLALRGPTRVRPMDGKINVLWVISHPEEVTEEEIDEFDLVYAASPMWARKMSARKGRTVHTLHQAVDVHHVPDSEVKHPLGIPVFVGTGRNRIRPVVHDALESGIDFAVYGPGWEGRVPVRFHRGGRVRNQDLIGLYRRHGLVLADHWSDMARHGFVSNRVFDAVAAGCRVICDDVSGLELFRGAAVSYGSARDLRDLVMGAGDFPSPRALRRIAGRVRREHSFDARARRLLADVVATRR